MSLLQRVLLLAAKLTKASYPLLDTTLASASVAV
ncbi:uncharacterized protein G2W53_003827 [Senna tora]|uniref:Uncharacterized protein n=1 Tax=Senna tora TaxID=362788 RepID=A0A835CGR5_9FABA|nr:uncharacterized protein G2W53_003827 [Senna tora]